MDDKVVILKRLAACDRYIIVDSSFISLRFKNLVFDRDVNNPALRKISDEEGKFYSDIGLTVGENILFPNETAEEFYRGGVFLRRYLKCLVKGTTERTHGGWGGEHFAKNSDKREQIRDRIEIIDEYLKISDRFRKRVVKKHPAETHMDESVMDLYHRVEPEVKRIHFEFEAQKTRSSSCIHNGNYRVCAFPEHFENDAIILAKTLALSSLRPSYVITGDGGFPKMLARFYETFPDWPYPTSVIYLKKDNEVFIVNSPERQDTLETLTTT